MVQEVFVATPEQLQKFCAAIQYSEWLAIDTEFLRQNTYYPELCLLQVATADIAACIDPQAIADLTPLLDILWRPEITKIFHAARQDLEIFFLRWKRLPTPLFDTQLAATLLGLGEQIGYGALVKALLKVDLEKDHSRTDWSRRPLSPAQLRYALDDVIYLGQAYGQLLNRLQQTGRDQWLKEDFSSLAASETYRIEPTKAWQRISDRRRLKGIQLAVLQVLAEWREHQAMKKNKPRNWLIKDVVLAEIARRMPDSPANLAKIRGLEADSQKRYGAELLELVSKAKHLSEEQWPLNSKGTMLLTPELEGLVDLLMAAVKTRAAAEQINPGILASRQTIEQLVRGDSESNVLQGWRRRLVGNDLLRLLNGETEMRVIAGRPEIL